MLLRHESLPSEAIVNHLHQARLRSRTVSGEQGGVRFRVEAGADPGSGEVHARALSRCRGQRRVPGRETPKVYKAFDS